MKIKAKILSLLLCIFILSACSTDDNNISSKTASVTINSQNVDMPTGGILSIQYGDWATGNVLSNVVDGDNNTKLVIPHNNFWIIWKGTAKRCINRCSITVANDYPEMNPKSWQLSASNDSINWNVLYTRKNYQFSENSQDLKQVIDTIQNEVSYTYYKLTILDNNGASSTQISEWSLDDVDLSYMTIDDLMQYSSGSTYSSLTPMGTNYENKHVTTSADRTWLQNASNEPSVPSSVSSLQLKHFDVTLYPYGIPEPADVNQHSIGDCGGLSALASMAYVHPAFIKSIIKENADGTFNVGMFDPQGNAVTVVVTSNFLATSGGTIEAVTGKDNVPTWSTVLEKAIMKWNMIYKVNTDIEGIAAEETTPLFTGDGYMFEFSPGKLTGVQLARVVKYSVTHGKFVTGGFWWSALQIGSLWTVADHIYAAMLPSNSQSLFGMRNPWGYNPGGNGSDDGVLNIPLSGQVVSVIDLRITASGRAGNTGVVKPYTPPSFAVSANNLRVAPRLIRNHK